MEVCFISELGEKNDLETESGCREEGKVPESRRSSHIEKIKGDFRYDGTIPWVTGKTKDGGCGDGEITSVTVD